MTVGGTPLLPEVLRAYPYSWSRGFAWDPGTEGSGENLAYARAVLEACLPPEPLAEPLPPEEFDRDGLPDWDDVPDWVVVRRVVRNHMPYTWDMTVGRMAEAEAECAAEGVDTTDFTERTLLLVHAWLAQETLGWVGVVVEHEPDLAPWLVDVVERYVARGMAVRAAQDALPAR
ncbi:hypothetical protein ACGFMM_19740 [Streptomyces sp. NPDC048604]|uniref:hypothetical protein n=1 Tax=Streptomyces sp. NPDC048604 TaxID=3365578 RepID=UPI003719BC7A